MNQTNKQKNREVGITAPTIEISFPDKTLFFILYHLHENCNIYCLQQIMAGFEEKLFFPFLISFLKFQE